MSGGQCHLTILRRFSLPSLAYNYVHKSGIKPYSFYFHLLNGHLKIVFSQKLNRLLFIALINIYRKSNEDLLEFCLKFTDKRFFLNRLILLIKEIYTLLKHIYTGWTLLPVLLYLNAPNNVRICVIMRHFLRNMQ